jgi:hypothetical protein
MDTPPDNRCAALGERVDSLSTDTEILLALGQAAPN